MKPVYCCKDCREVYDRFLFYSPVLRDGHTPNQMQGRCRNCGSFFSREGYMKPEFEQAWLAGRLGDFEPDFVTDWDQVPRDDPTSVNRVYVGTSFVGYGGLRLEGT